MIQAFRMLKKYPITQMGCSGKQELTSYERKRRVTINLESKIAKSIWHICSRPTPVCQNRLIVLWLRACLNGVI
jgi:hypothetical protein